MSAILDLNGVICRIDDILIHGRNHNIMEHDACVQGVLFCLEKAGLTLNIQEREFGNEDPSSLFFETQVHRTYCGCLGSPCWPRDEWSFSNPYKCNRSTEVHGHGLTTGTVCPWLSRYQNTRMAPPSKEFSWYSDEVQLTTFKQVNEKLASPEILPHYNPNIKQSLLQMRRHQGRTGPLD